VFTSPFRVRNFREPLTISGKEEFPNFDDI